MLQIRKKFQITLPLSIREQLGLEEGDYLAVEARDDEIVLRSNWSLAYDDQSLEYIESFAS